MTDKGTATDTADATGAVIVSFKTAAEESPETVGTKAFNLARLAAAGFAVPDGVVLTTRAFQQFVEANEGLIASGAYDTAGLQVPDEVSRALEEGLQAMGGAPFAVRSSGTSEDQAGASYAGQYETVLNVRDKTEAADAIKRCCASAFSDRVRGYRGAMGQTDTPHMAVLLQRMIDADAAGVAFTANPVTGDRGEVVINAVAGLGDRLVSGEATPDEWVVRNGQAEAHGQPEDAISESQAVEIANVARRVEEFFGAPQDIEWAIAGGQVFLLQSRPITALPTPPVIEPPPGTWMKDTVHYSGPLSPLAATSYPACLESGTGRMCEEFGFMMEGVRQGVIGWEIYMQPLPPSGEDVAGQRIAAAIEAVGSDKAGQLAESWQRGGWKQEFMDRIEALRSRRLEGLDAEGLDAHLQECLDLLEEGQAAHFRLFPAFLLAVYDLAKVSEELLGWDTPTALDLVSGLSETSSEPARDLAALAADIREDVAAAEAVRSWTPAEPLEALLARLREARPDLADRLEAHVDRYGCRVPAYDVGDPTFAERPELTMRLLRDLVNGAQDPNETQRQLARQREEAAERARSVLEANGASEEDRARFEEALDRARRRWGLREDNLLYTDTMPNGVFRLAALEIGRRLAADGRLRSAEEAVWLELEELRTALRDPDGRMASDLTEKVARRRCEQAWVRANPGPPMYGDPPPPPPPMDGLPPEVQRINGAMHWLMGIEFAPPGDGGSVEEALRGLRGSPGRATGTVRMVRDETEFGRVGPGDVLVCRLTTPAWTSLFARASAVVTDAGSPLSHAAIVAREHGIPAVVGTQIGTQTLRDGQTVTVDGTNGTVEIH